MRILVIVAVLSIIVVPGLAAAAKTQSEDDAKWQKVDNTNKARALYLAGEAANKKGEYRTAVKCWMAAMELKPDSDFTRKCLAQAREKLYKQYNDYELAHRTGDPLSCYVMLEEMVTLVPDKPDLPGRLEKATGDLNENQTKALASYKKALELYTKGDLVSAKTTLADAEQYAPNADCVKRLAQAISGLPKMVYLGADWCPFCRRMKPVLAQIKERYAGRLILDHIDTTSDSREKNYDYDSIPTMFFYDSKGNEIKRISGARTLEELEPVFAQIGVK